MLLVSFGGFRPWHRDVGWEQLPTCRQEFSSCSSCHVIQFSGGDPGGCGLVSLPLIFMKTLETRSTEHQHVYNLHISLCSIPHLSREEYLTLTPVSTILYPSSYHCSPGAAGRRIFTAVGILHLGQEQDPGCLTASGFGSPGCTSGQAEICIRGLTTPANTHTTQTKTPSADTLSIAEKSSEMPFGILLTRGMFPPLG